MKICPHCQGEHDDQALFCPTTGKAISVSRIQEGTLIDGKYRIIRRLASGGMGAVYEVIHERIKRRLALKLILPELAANEEVSQRFEIEAQAASAIGHENIVEVTDMGTTGDGLPFLVMEFLEGQDLAALLAAEERLSEERARHIVGQILSGLAAAHARQIIHRDLKPENVFLIEKGDDPEFVKLLDFGISKICGSDESRLKLTSTGLILGTPYYMSPEQARGEREIDQRSDLFSVGTILYQCVTGRRPFTARNLNSLIYQIIGGQITPPSEANPDLSEEVVRVLSKALAVDPEHRFQEAGEFRAALLGERQISVSELPPARVSRDSRQVPVAYSPTIPSDSASPLRAGTPLAWTGEQAPAERHGGRLVLYGAIGAALLAAVGAWFLLGRSGAPKRSDKAPSPAPMAAAPKARRPAMPAAMPAVMPVLPARIRITLELEPADARVLLDGKLVAQPIWLDRSEESHKLRVEKPGYQAREYDIQATSDRIITAHLTRAAPPRAGRRPPRRPVVRVPPRRPAEMRGMRRIEAIDRL